jgi:hypothetical protein
MVRSRFVESLIGVLHEKTILRTAESMELSSGSKGFLDVLFLFGSRKISPKGSEVRLLENRGFSAIGVDKKSFVNYCALKKLFQYDIRIQHEKTNI